MTTHKIVGTVAGLWRFPVKSMGGERLAEAELTPTGLESAQASLPWDHQPGQPLPPHLVRSERPRGFYALMI